MLEDKEDKEDKEEVEEDVDEDEEVEDVEIEEIKEKKEKIIKKDIDVLYFLKKYKIILEKKVKKIELLKKKYSNTLNFTNNLNISS